MKRANPPVTARNVAGGFTDCHAPKVQDIVSIAQKAKNGKAFSELFKNGDTSKYNNDDSSADMLDGIFNKMYDKGLSQTTVRNVHRVLSVSFEGARKYRYIERNPASDILTKFGKQGKTPDPYTIAQMQQLMGHVSGTEWELPIMLAGMYGLRISEALGLRWKNVDISKGTFNIVEQLPFRLPAGTTIVEEMAVVKGKGADNAGERVLPITKATQPYFERHIELQARQRELATNGGGSYFENNIVVAKANGTPHRRDQVSANFGQMLRRSGFPYIRFHDLRHPYVKQKLKKYFLIFYERRFYTVSTIQTAA